MSKLERQDMVKTYVSRARTRYRQTNSGATRVYKVELIFKNKIFKSFLLQLMIDNGVLCASLKNWS